MTFFTVFRRMSGTVCVMRTRPFPTAPRIGAAALLAATVAATAGCSSGGAGAEAAAPTGPAAAPVALDLGDCVRTVLRPEGRTLDEADCESSHHGEVVLASDEFFASDDELPSEARLVRIADTACVDAMKSYGGKPIEQTPYRMSYLYPTQQTWDEGDRKLTCVAIAYDTQFDTLLDVTGSIKAP